MRTLVYTPLIYNFDEGMQPPTCPDTWYFEWQRTLWNWFSNIEDVNVIWKAPPRRSVLIDPIKQWKASNIRYIDGNLNKELKKADIMFCDYPSTTMLDASKIGVPFICIVISWKWDLRFMRERVLQGCGIYLRDNENEVLRLLGMFIEKPVKFTLELDDKWLQRIVRG